MGGKQRIHTCETGWIRKMQANKKCWKDSRKNKKKFFPVQHSNCYQDESGKGEDEMVLPSHALADDGQNKEPAIEGKVIEQSSLLFARGMLFPEVVFDCGKKKSQNGKSSQQTGWR